jgi:tetratricopeptide (TPR) repeat protein
MDREEGNAAAVTPTTEREKNENENEAPGATETDNDTSEKNDVVELADGAVENIDVRAGDYTPPNMSKDEIRQQAQAAMLGRLSKEEEAERSQRNKELLPSEKNLGHMTIEEKYDFARKYKDAGNVFFKEGRYEFAIKNYNETITYVRHGLRMGETDSEGIPFAAKATGLDPEAKAVIAVCYSNMAACSLKLSRFEEAIKHATTALGQDLKDAAKAKALFRRSKAYHTLGKIEEAYEDITEAKKIDQNEDKAIQMHHKVVFRILKERVAKLREAQKKMYLGKLTKEDDQEGPLGEGKGDQSETKAKPRSREEDTKDNQSTMANTLSTIPFVGQLTHFIFKVVNRFFDIFRSS